MTMIAAVGMAFGLFADGFQTTGASFEPNGTYQGVTLTWDKDGFNQNYWSSFGESATFEGTYTFNKEIGYPTVFAKDHTQYLKIKTTLGTPAVMKIAENPVGVGDSGLYFDAMVNMTVFDYGEDSNPAIPTGTKIAAYLQLASDADNAATNFVVATAANKRYVCADADVSEGWHRITIKAIKNVYQTGKTAASAFKVFVDGVAVSCAAAKADFTADDLTPVAREYYNAETLFLSGVSTEAEIASVSFDGQGSVDDIVFTEAIPFAAAGDAAKAQVIIAADAAGVVTGVSTNGVDNWVTTYPAIFDAPIQGGKVYIRASGAYCLTELDAPADGGTLTVTESMLIKAKATFDNTAYETVAKAVAEANKVTSGTHTLALIDDATEAVQFMNTAMAANTIVFDLAGQKLTGNFGNTMPTTAIVITNSTDEVGSIDGTVQGANLSIFGGKFLYSANEGGINATFPAGKKLVNDGATPAYWVLADISYVAKIGDKGYETLKAAFAALKNGDKLEIIADASTNPEDGSTTIKNMGTIEIVNNATVTLADLIYNGDYNFQITDTTIKFSGTGTWVRPAAIKDAKTGDGGGSIFRCNSNAVITVDGGTYIAGTNGTDSTTNGGSSNIFQGKGWSSITINDGTFINYRYDQGRCVRADATDASVTINGGTFWTNPESKGGSGTAERVVPVDNKGNGTVSIKGGKFKCHPDNVTEIMNPFCGEDYKLKDDGTGWLVRTPIDYVTLTVTKDANVTAVVVSNATKEVTLDVDGKAKFDKDDEVVVTAYPTFAAGYELDTEKSTALTATMTADATINIVAKSVAPEIPTVTPGAAPVQVNEEDADKVVISAKSPDTKVVSDEAYTAYFKKLVSPVGGGKVNVSAVLDEEAIEFAESVEDLGGEVSKIAAGAESATIAAKPGLYYYVEEANDVTKIAEPDRDRVMATGDTVTVPTTKFTGSGFYRLNCSTTQRGIVTQD